VAGPLWLNHIPFAITSIEKIIDGLKQTENAKKEQIVRSLNMLTDMLDIQDLEVK